MEVQKKSNKGLIILVVVLIVLLLGSTGYICYDKGVFDGLIGKDKTVQNSKNIDKSKETFKFEGAKVT